jgi:hypothetical protein
MITSDDDVLMIWGREHRISGERIRNMMIFPWDPLHSETITQQFSHQSLDADVIDGVEVLPVENANERLMIRYHRKFRASEIQAALFNSPLDCQRNSFLPG